MPSLAWYKSRLSAMTPQEVIWRAKSAVRERIDRYRCALGVLAPHLDLRQIHPSAGGPGFHVGGAPQAGGWVMPPAWGRELIRKASRIVDHQLSFFDLQDVFLGTPIDWNRDHAHGKAAPMGPCASIDYRDFRVTGDCKLVWEPNRHIHLTVLGRAYRITGERRFACEAIEQIRSWMGQCPYGRGMNWRSPLELGIRLINWVWTIDLIRESGLMAGEFRSRLLQCVYLHLREITRKYSQGSSANNHLVGEAAGAFVASAYFTEMPDAGPWAVESQVLLEREIMAQTYSDGCTREHATGYHLFVLQFFLLAGLVGRWSGREFAPAYWRRIERMLEFAAALSEDGDRLPMFGDADDGYVLDLGQGPVQLKDLLCVGAVLFNRPDFKRCCGGLREPALWLLGSEAAQCFGNQAPDPAPRPPASRGFQESGYYVLQSGQSGADRVSVVVDCAELGYKSIAAHGHADALGFVLRAFGSEIFVDPGTYDYFTYPDWRSYFRSTRAHNAVVVDDADQSEMIGPFMWGRRANAICIDWDPWPEGGGRIVAEHDGYRRLKDPVVHRRSIELDPQTRRVTVTDEIFAAAHHRVEIFFHLAEHCTATVVSADQVGISLPGGELTLAVDPRLELTLLAGSESPKGGWVSRGYHRKAPASLIIAAGTCSGNAVFRSTISIGMPDGTNSAGPFPQPRCN
jgi:hypothetical protein